MAQSEAACYCSSPAMFLLGLSFLDKEEKFPIGFVRIA